MPNRRAATRALYDLVPDAGCKGLCAEACGPVPMSSTERATIRARHGIDIPPPEVTLQLVALGQSDGTCPALAAGRCSVYEDRPMICRLYGVTDDPKLRCEHGCEPSEPMIPPREGHALLRGTLEAAGDPLPGERGLVNVRVPVVPR